jgi:hypothetical protein
MWPVQMKNWWLLFYLNFINLKNHVWLVAAVLDSTVLDMFANVVYGHFSFWKQLSYLAKLPHSLTELKPKLAPICI